MLCWPWISIRCQFQSHPFIPPPPPAPPPPPPSPSSTFISRAKAQISSCRPWREVFDFHVFSLPDGYADGFARIRRNSNYFRVNYALTMLLILFLGLLYHPISMIVFLVVFVAWLYFYFWRESSNVVVVLNKSIDDRVVLVGLIVVTIVGLVLTSVGLNVLVSLVIAVVAIGLHAGFRNTNDLFLDEHDAAAVEGGLMSGIV
ncbi:PRA1 family protein E-like [Impatiens glandulifera]|uniref:PRA1 family protein E-like n=1 Tax=Impatiens glandulifera TaxID=253017 RepID=UPI001FB07444|nr:PRA1 family protein E-like [Impatiens glandulifera]